MSWKCALGLHSPSAVSIARKDDHLHALCEGCSIPLLRTAGDRRWRVAEPLVGPEAREKSA
jgi:hypothetical protein